MTREERVQKQKAEEQVREIAFMVKTKAWPLWPVLPMKRSEGGGHFPTMGFLVAGKGPAIHRGAIHAVNPGDRWDSFSREMYESFEALYAAGWRVD